MLHICCGKGQQAILVKKLLAVGKSLHHKRFACVLCRLGSTEALPEADRSKHHDMHVTPGPDGKTVRTVAAQVSNHIAHTSEDTNTWL